jgi:hypothetical protein
MSARRSSVRPARGTNYCARPKSNAVAQFVRSGACLLHPGGRAGDRGGHGAGIELRPRQQYQATMERYGWYGSPSTSSPLGLGIGMSIGAIGLRLGCLRTHQARNPRCDLDVWRSIRHCHRQTERANLLRRRDAKPRDSASQPVAEGAHSRSHGRGAAHLCVRERQA